MSYDVKEGKMFGLFMYTYDYHEWENLIAVSKSRGRLLECYLGMVDGRPPRAIDDDHHESYRDEEIKHVYIREVEEI